MTTPLQKSVEIAHMLTTAPGVAENPARFLGRLARWRWLTSRGRHATVPFPHYGVEFWCPPEWRGMSKMAYTLHDVAEPDLPMLGRWVSRFDRVLDVGAHYGAYTVALASLVGDGGEVIAVEPAPHAREVLATNVALNGLGQVQVVAAAVGDEPGEAELHLHVDASRASLNGVPGSNGAVTVPVVRLDDEVPDDGRPVTFIKIDVEGYEHPALSGASRILAKDRPVVQFEYQPVTADRGGLGGAWEVLAGHGYRFVQLDPASGRYEPVVDRGAAQHGNLLALPS